MFWITLKERSKGESKNASALKEIAMTPTSFWINKKKKINEDPLLQPATQTSATGFGNEQISDTQPKIRELTETTAYRILQPHQQALIKNFLKKPYLSKLINFI